MPRSTRPCRATTRLTRPGWPLLLLVAALSATASWAQPGDSLLLHLEFEGDLLDSSPNMHDGTGFGTLGFSPGVFGMAVSFSGDDSVLFPSVPDAAFSTGAFSVTFWFDTPVNRKASFLGKRAICDFAPFVDIRAIPGRINFEISDAAGNHAVDASRAAGWHFFSAVREPGLIQLYIDGVLRSEKAFPAIDIENAAPLGLSTSPCIGVGGSTETLLGELDDLRVYDRALTAAEIAAVTGLVLADGFESGDTSAWSSTTP